MILTQESNEENYFEEVKRDAEEVGECLSVKKFKTTTKTDWKTAIKKGIRRLDDIKNENKNEIH